MQLEIASSEFVDAVPGKGKPLSTYFEEDGKA